MTLWGNIDYDSGNNKPKYANTTNTTCNSTINGARANTDHCYGPVYGISPTEMENNYDSYQKPAHAGWTASKIGTGPVASITANGYGFGYNAAGYFILTDTSALGKGSGANVGFTIANAQNIMQSYSTNAQLNVINTITVYNGGSGYSENSKISMYLTQKGAANSGFSITLGGRGDRKNFETLVAMGSITGDDPRDNVYFAGP